MMNSPEFLQQMSSLMANPAVLEQALALNPQYASMGPQAREIFQSERFRQMMFVPLHFGLPSRAKSSSRSNPETLRGMIQMASMMRGAGLDGTPTPNLFGGDPSALLQLLGGASPSADARPPEERFQVQLQVRHFVVPCAFEMTCIRFIAITRYGLLQCFPECARPACDRRERAFGD